MHQYHEHASLQFLKRLRSAAHLRGIGVQQRRSIAHQRHAVPSVLTLRLQLNRKGLFGARTTVTKVLSWKNEVIKKALLKMPSKELETTAVQVRTES